MDLTIVIPIYNEEKNLAEFLQQIIGFCSSNNIKLILVNDGSTDGSQDVLERVADNNNVVLVNHKINRGYGAAIKSGIKKCETKYVATLDADGQHNEENILALHKKIEETNADLVIGKRSNSVDTLFRSFGKKLILVIARILIDFKYSDINSGMKIYITSEVAKFLKLAPNNFSFNILPLVFTHFGRKVIEQNIEVRRREHGKSKVNRRAGLDIILEIFSIVMLFNPLKIFFPFALLCVIAGVAWGIPFIIEGKGVTVGSMLAIVTGVIIFFMGIIAEQLSRIRKDMI